MSGQKTLVFDDIYKEYVLPGTVGRYQVDFIDVPFETPVYLSGDFKIKYSSTNDFYKSEYSLYNLTLFTSETEDIKLSCRKQFLTSGTWTDQGYPFYSGEVTYQCEFKTDFPADFLELVMEGVWCEVSLDGVPLGGKSMSPCQFPLTQCLPGQHTLKVSITNTLGNQLEQFRVPSGLIQAKILKTQDKS